MADLPPHWSVSPSLGALLHGRRVWRRADGWAVVDRSEGGRHRDDFMILSPAEIAAMALRPAPEGERRPPLSWLRCLSLRSALETCDRLRPLRAEGRAAA